MKPVSLKEIVSGLRALGLDLLDLRAGDRTADLPGLSRALLSMKGEAAAVALAGEVIATYDATGEGGREAFFDFLLNELAPDRAAVDAAIATYQATPSAATVAAIAATTEAPRLELLRAINMTAGGTAAIVAMRADLLALLPRRPDLRLVDDDFRHLLASWFNRGFLQLRRIGWQTPAVILEKLIAYESVHEIRGWPDLRRRLAEDRRCYGFFHPALADEPLIFVQVALTDGLADSIDGLLSAGAPTGPVNADTAVFYSINNCQAGLRGINFGNFLIKQVVEDLSAELPELKTFATLSPVPGFLAWLRREVDAGSETLFVDEEERALVATVFDPAWMGDDDRKAGLEEPLTRLCAHYLAEARQGDEPLDSVARFHLRNGARLERINWLGDTSENGLRQSAGLLANYLYDRRTMAANHEAYANSRRVALSPALSKLLNPGRVARARNRNGKKRA